MFVSGTLRKRFGQKSNQKLVTVPANAQLNNGSALGPVFAHPRYHQVSKPDYSKSYGSLGAVIVLMLWLYLTGVAVLIGGEINSEIENAAAKKGAAEAKKKGEKSPNKNRGRAKAA